MNAVVTKEVFLREWVPTLPQASMIKESDAAAWYDSVMVHDPTRLRWHFDRLRGFGGSDIGDIVAWRLGLPGFARPEDVVYEKLMRTPLVAANKFMKRGIRAEPLIRDHFREEYDAVPREDLVQAIRQATMPAHPWARGNPDDILEIGGKLYLADYKAKSYPANTAAINYAAQLHDYDLLLWASRNPGKEPDVNRTTPLCFDDYLIVYYDYPGAKSHPIRLDYDPDVMRAVIEAGDYAWDAVMGRREIEFPRKDQVDYLSKQQLSAEEKKSLNELNADWVTHKAIADAAYSRAADAKREMAQLLSAGGTRRSSLLDAQFKAANAYFLPEFDEEAITMMASRANFDVEALKKETGVLDAEAMAQRLMDLGHTPIYQRDFDVQKVAEFCHERGLRLPVTEEPVLQLSRAHRHKQFVDDVKERARGLVGGAAVKLVDFISSSSATTTGELSFEAEAPGRQVLTSDLIEQGGQRDRQTGKTILPTIGAKKADGMAAEPVSKDEATKPRRLPGFSSNRPRH